MLLTSIISPTRALHGASWLCPFATANKAQLSSLGPRVQATNCCNDKSDTLLNVVSGHVVLFTKSKYAQIVLYPGDRPLPLVTAGGTCSPWPLFPSATILCFFLFASFLHLLHLDRVETRSMFEQQQQILTKLKHTHVWQPRDAIQNDTEHH